MAHNFVESEVPLRAIKSAVELQHSHPNKPLLDSLVSDGSSVQYLGADGTYHEFPAMFFPTAFVDNYDQNLGNVKAYVQDGKLYLNTVNTFAKDTNGRVVGSIELESGETDKQVNVSVAEVDVNTGAVVDGGFKYILVGSGLSVSFNDGVLSIATDITEEPFSHFMEKQDGAQAGIVGVFGADGQIVNGGVLLSDLVTTAILQQHINNTDLHVSAALQAEWSAKQAALTAAQLTAVNSGITAVKVQQYDGYAASKLNVGGHDVSKNVVTDADGNIALEDKFDPATKISVVAGAVQNKIAIFAANGQLKDSGIELGAFSSSTTIKDYIDNAVTQAVSGSSYQGTFTYFGSQSQVESTEAVAGDTAIVYVGAIDKLQGLLRGDYDGSAWTFANVNPAPSNGMWFEVDVILTTTPPAAGRIIVRMDGIHDPSLDVRVQAAVNADNNTIALDSQGRLSFKFKTLSSGKQVLNATTADNIAYEFTSTGDTDTSKTIKEVIDEQGTKFEPKFTKNTAFNKNFDTSSQSGTSSMVIGDKDTRLTNSRPASDVYAWAKATTKPTYTYSEVGALAAGGTAVAASKLATARALQVELGTAVSASFDGSADATSIGVSGTLSVSNGGTGKTTLTSGYALIGAGTSAVSLRAITSTPSSGSTSLFTAGGAYTLAAGKQNKITVSSSQPSGSTGDIWFNATPSSDENFTINYYDGSAWRTLKPSPANPSLFLVGSGTAITGATKLSWSGSAGNYSCSIAFAAHGKGYNRALAKYFPKVRTFNVSGNNWEETYDSPIFDITTGTVTVYSNSNADLYVMIS